MRRLLDGFEQFLEDGNRVWQMVDVADHLAERRADLLEHALVARLPLPEVPGHDVWTLEAERLAEDGRAVLSDPGRFGPHMGDADRETFGSEVAKLERALDIDRREAQLLRDLGDGQPDDNLADRIRRLERRPVRARCRTRSRRFSATTRNGNGPRSQASPVHSWNSAWKGGSAC